MMRNCPILAVVLCLACSPSSKNTSGGESSGVEDGNGGNNNARGSERPDAQVAIRDDNTSINIDPGQEITVVSPSGRASITFSAQALAETAKISIESQPLSAFEGTDAIINGIYAFLPEETPLQRPASITLPLNGFLVEDTNELELVRYAGGEWSPSSGARLSIEDGSVTGDIAALGTYGLRFTAGELSANFQDPGQGGTISGPVKPAGFRWREQKVREVFVEPDCRSAEAQVSICEDWLQEKRQLAGIRWRTGACFVEKLPTNPGWPQFSVRPPITWGCKLVGEYIRLVEHDKVEEVDQTWELRRMYEGRFCERADDPNLKRECDLWIADQREYLTAMEAGITLATCTRQPVPSLSGVNHCQLWGHVSYIGFPPKL